MYRLMFYTAAHNYYSKFDFTEATYLSMKTYVPAHKIPIEQLYGEIHIFCFQFSPPLVNLGSQNKLKL